MRALVTGGSGTIGGAIRAGYISGRVIGINGGMI